MAHRPPPRDWSTLAAGTNRRWVSAFGGSRSLSPAERATRAERAYQRGAHLPEEKTGHAPPPLAEFALVATTDGLAPITGTSRRENSRLGTYAHDTRELLAGEMTDREFGKKWNRRVRTVGDFELESDPAVVRVLWAISGPAPQPFYTKRRRSGGAA
jgi:hypothetical protein